MIKLVEDTIDKNDIEKLIEWLKTNPRLTQSKVTRQFEEEWARWLGVSDATYVNSGSSANLLMIYALKLSGRLRNNKIVVPAVSWATTVAPLIQLGFEPILCECDRDTLGIDPSDLKRIIKNLMLNPAAVITVDVLGFPNKYREIQNICWEHGIPLLEDSCESVGSHYNGIKTGNFGTMSTFSFYFGHHISTIEGGMICTSDDELNQILKMIRSHGWDRDLKPHEIEKIRKEYNVDDFKKYFTFYFPGFNVRATDLQAKIGLEQMKKVNEVCVYRSVNYEIYQKEIKNSYWKPNTEEDSFISNFAYPIIHPKRDEIAKKLLENEIECRPLVCGSMSEQPFFKKHDKHNRHLPFALEVDKYGMYLPNNPKLNIDNINKICDIVNGVING